MSNANLEESGKTVLTVERGDEARPVLRANEFPLTTFETHLAPEPPQRNFAGEALHALRRRWLVAVLIGLLLAPVAAVATWFGLARQYTAIAVLRVTYSQANLLDLGQNLEGTARFEYYKKTQRQLLRSPVVLASVLQRKEIANLPLVVQQADPLAWLQNVVAVTFPDDAEIMQVSVRCSEQSTAETLANLIVEVYLSDVVQAERRQNLDGLGALQNAVQATQRNLRVKRTELKNLVDALGSGDSEALTLAQKNKLQEYSVLFSQLSQVEIDLSHAQIARKLRQSGVRPEMTISPEELEGAAFNDPEILALKARMQKSQAALERDRKHLYGAIEKEYIENHQNEMQRAKKQIAERTEVLRKEVAFKKAKAAEAANQSQQASVELLTEHRDNLAKKVAILAKEAEKFGRSSVEVELLRAEIKGLEELEGRLQKKYQQANMELSGSKPRVVSLSAARTSASEDTERRMKLSGSSAGFSFFLGCALVVLWDLRRHRLNTVNEIAGSLRLPQLGTLPHIPRISRRSNTRLGLEDAIDGIVAKLVFSPSGEKYQSVLVTSASAGEGKSTLAINLATSFAGMGRRTVLVDFDLRRPTLHRMFDVELTPGVGGVLDGTITPLDAVVPTSSPDLFLLPGGAWGQRGLSHRNDETVKRIIEDLRGEFTHVVIDAGPVLPVVDTRLVARHTDGVIVSLLRDVSEIPKVGAACQLLRSFEVPIIGAVMIGAPAEVYYSRTIPNDASSA